jgi:phage tail-like protein
MSWGDIEDLAEKGADAAKKEAESQGKDLAKKGIDAAEDGIGDAIDDTNLFDWAKDLAKEGVSAGADALKDSLGLGDKPLESPISKRKDHHGGFRFRVEIGSITAAAFSSVDGLSMEVEMIEYQGGGDRWRRQIPGRPKVSPVTLKKGYVLSTELWSWMESTAKGDLDIRNCSIIIMGDAKGEDKARYELYECWPSKWSGLQLDANGSNALVEEIELQVRYMKRSDNK